GAGAGVLLAPCTTPRGARDVGCRGAGGAAARGGAGVDTADWLGTGRPLEVLVVRAMPALRDDAAVAGAEDEADEALLPVADERMSERAGATASGGSAPPGCSAKLRI